MTGNITFPALDYEVDMDCRASYKGGWTYVNPKYRDVRIGEGKVYDVNSMYPWAMMYCLLPYGEPIYYEGEYVQDDMYPLYIQCLRCNFKIKHGKYPSIQIKRSLRFVETEYLSECEGEAALLHLTSVDYELMKENYNIWNVEYLGGYKFRGRVGMFTEYVEYWYSQKTNAKKDANNAMATLAKLFLNGLYGKYGTSPDKRSKYPYLDAETDTVKYKLSVSEKKKGLYVPVASFITSYCRDKIIRAANSCGERFLYADTDSLHIMGLEEPNIDIDPYRLGAFKEESTFTDACYHRTKCYIETINGVLDVKCAGMPDSVKGYMTYETMDTGFVFGIEGTKHADNQTLVIIPEDDAKLRPVNVPGGQVLLPVKFSLK